MLIHITGDSLAARYEGYGEPILNALLKEALPGLSVTNTAISGNNSRDLLERLEGQILCHAEPDVLFIMIGANDLAVHKQVGLSDFSSYVGTILGRLRQTWPATKVILISPPPVDETKQRHRCNATVESYTQEMAQLSKRYNCYLLNLYAFFTNQRELELDILMTGLLDDGLHFGQVGYEVLVKQLVKMLEADV